MTPDYRPVPCTTYSAYELAIVRGHSLRLWWRGPRGEDRVETVVPLDLRTRRRAEYMIVRAAGGRRILRLDRIRRADALVVHSQGPGRP